MRKTVKYGMAALFCMAAAGALFLYWCAAQLPERFWVQEGQSLSICEMPFITAVRSSDTVSEAAVTNPPSYAAELRLFGMIPVKTVRVEVTERRVVSVYGTPFGIKMFQDGVMVIGFSDIETENGKKNPAKEAGLQLGDIVNAVGGQTVTTNEQVAAAFQSTQGQGVKVEYKRDGEAHVCMLYPVKDKSLATYRSGMWVRDSSAGIGTMTFVDNDTKIFAGLGHSINDTDTGKIVPLLSGEIVPVEVTGVEKSLAGTPGQIKGRFASAVPAGTIRANDESGVYGILYMPERKNTMEVALPQEVAAGPAQIYTTLDASGPQWYDIEIEKVSLNSESRTKNMVLRITDKKLLKKTGGIVQGMSGSPIVQNGRLVGAVTHVLVNDPVRGYGIFAEYMLEEADNVRAASQKTA